MAKTVKEIVQELSNWNANNICNNTIYNLCDEILEAHEKEIAEKDKLLPSKEEK